MTVLRRGGQFLAPVEIANSLRDRTSGLLGRDSLTWVLVLRPANWVHTMGMRFAIDVAFCDRHMVVLRTVRMTPHRLCRPLLRSRCVLEAEAGAFTSWDLRPGDRLELADG